MMSLVEGRLNLKCIKGIKTGCPKGTQIYWSGTQKSDSCVGFRYESYQQEDEKKERKVEKVRCPRRNPERLWRMRKAEG